jgi:hypothetical protein
LSEAKSNADVVFPVIQPNLRIQAFFNLAKVFFKVPQEIYFSPLFILSIWGISWPS